MVKSGWLASEMPLANDGGFVARLLKDFGKDDLGTVEGAAGIGPEAVDVTVSSSENGGTTRPTERVWNETTVKANPFFGQPINVRSLNQG